jgi:hypothetical protein
MSGDTTTNIPAKTISLAVDTYSSVPFISRYENIWGYQSPIRGTLRPLVPEGKRLERETGRSHTSNAESDKAVLPHKSSWRNSLLTAEKTVPYGRARTFTSYQNSNLCEKLMRIVQGVSIRLCPPMVHLRNY